MNSTFTYILLEIGGFSSFSFYTHKDIFITFEFRNSI